MKIPKYIDKLLDKRARSAMQFISCDNKIVEWLEKNNIEFKKIAFFDCDFDD